MKRLFTAPSFVSFSVALAIALVMAWVEPSFATAQNFFNILRNAAFIAIMALGTTPILIAGGIDLSIGSVMALGAIATGMALEHGASLYVGLGVGLGIGLVCGFINGALIATLRLSPFIVTLAMLSGVRSLALVLSNGKSFYRFGSDADLFAWLGGGAFWGIPLPALVVAALWLWLGFALRYLRWGRYVYALGSKEKAALAAGIPVRLVRFSTYVIGGLATALAAILMTGWLGGVTNNMGMGYELNVIAACVIGGVGLSGAHGNATAPVVGALLLEIIRNAFLLAGFNAYWQGFFVGAILLAAVGLQKKRAFSP